MVSGFKYIAVIGHGDFSTRAVSKGGFEPSGGPHSMEFILEVPRCLKYLQS